MTVTIRGLLKLAREQIASEEAQLETELLLSQVLNKPRSYLHTWPDEPLSAEHVQSFNSLVQRRVDGEPIAYILGEWSFWSLSLEVNRSTLIPRADTECLVEQSLSLSLANDARVLDLGTGTGAIALALARERPNWNVEACDAEDQAVKLAQRNQQRNNIANLNCYRSDWFENVEGQFELIVSNPPYIEEHDPHLHELQFEPKSALVSADAGLADIKAIIDAAPKYLRKNAYLILEHGWTQGSAVRALMAPCFDCIQSCRDYGGNERMTMGKLKLG
jgi:release factor glutamine methyltransferase